MELGLAIWGAVVATVLAIRELVAWRRDRPHIRVEAGFSRSPMPADENVRDPRAVTVADGRGGELGVLLAFHAVNSGTRSMQLVAVHFETDRHLHQVIPSTLPAVLEPNSRVAVTLQVEWIASTAKDGLRSMGFLDAIGNRHNVTPNTIANAIDTVNGLPHRYKTYQRRPEVDDEQTPEFVQAFQAYDRAVLAIKGIDSTRRWRQIAGRR